MSTYNIHRELAKFEWLVRKERDLLADLRDATDEAHKLGGEPTVAMEYAAWLLAMVAKQRSVVAAEIAGVFDGKEEKP